MLNFGGVSLRVGSSKIIGTKTSPKKTRTAGGATQKVQKALEKGDSELQNHGGPFLVSMLN